MKPSNYIPLFETRRGSIQESLHFGAVAVVDSGGKLFASSGDPQTTTFLRSTAKPFQALPLIENGGHHHWHLSPKEIAILCASHTGTDDHVETVRGMQAKIGIDEGDLKCGIHWPADKETSNAMRAHGESPTPLHHNCSGKHTGMLALAKMQNRSLDDYLEPEHPIQEQILGTISDMCMLAPEEITLGTDGCSAPNFAMPLFNAAWGLARFVDPGDLPTGRAEACRTITGAISAHPKMIAGPGRFDTRLIRVGDGKVIVKSGAEGYLGIGVMPGARNPQSPGLGIALKISDGDGQKRARPAVALEVLKQLDFLSNSQLEELATFGPVTTIKNRRELVVGEGRPVFALDIAAS